MVERLSESFLFIVPYRACRWRQLGQVSSYLHFVLGSYLDSYVEYFARAAGNPPHKVVYVSFNPDKCFCRSNFFFASPKPCRSGVACSLDNDTSRRM